MRNHCIRLTVHNKLLNISRALLRCITIMELKIKIGMAYSIGAYTLALTEDIKKNDHVYK